MKSVFICKTRTDAVKNSNNESSSNNFVRIVDIEKFALRTYNRFVHDREINNFFVANCLIKLSKYYFFFKNEFCFGEYVFIDDRNNAVQIKQLSHTWDVEQLN